MMQFKIKAKQSSPVFSYMKDSEEMCNMCITGEGGNSIKCYSVLLANLSPLVRDVLQDQDKSWSSYQIILPDFKVEDILHVMKLVYFGK